MTVTVFFLFSTSIVFGSLFNIRHPEKPGLYGVRFGESGESEFVELENTGILKTSLHPSSWDFRTVNQSYSITNVFDQGSCGGCWAFSSADVAGASLYLNKGINTVLSPQYMIDCHAVVNYQGYTYEQSGCNGGYPIVAFVDIRDNGLPTQQCVSWVRRERSTCPTKCDNNTSLNKGANKDANFHLVDAYKVSLQTLRDLVTTSGPCIAEMYAYDDLSDYAKVNGKFPVYKHNPSLRNYEGHAVTVYGFGTQDGEDYWLIKNSWGSTFGEGGFFKIKMGTNESGIENNFYSLYNNSNDYTNVPPSEGGGGGDTPGNDWNNTNECKNLPQSTCVQQTYPNGSAKCEWYPNNINGTFCDYSNAVCEEFDSTRCDLAVSWGLNCVPGKYTCVDPDQTVCSDVSASACQATKGCRLYTNGGVENCNVQGVQCAWFDTNSTECETTSADYELRCVYDTSVNPSCFTLSSLCTPMERLECSTAIQGPTLNCHWYDGGSTKEGFCDVNNARCSWFSPENCVSESEKFDGMKCEVIDGLCSGATKVALSTAWVLFAALLISLFL